MATALAAAILLHNHTDIEAHQRADVRAQAAIGSRHQHAVPDAGQADTDLLDARVEGTGGHINTLEQLDLFRPAQHIQRIVGGVQRRQQRAAEGLHAAILSGAGNRASRLGRQAQGVGGDGIAVGESGFLTRLGTHPNPLIEIETAFLDDAILQRPGF